MYLQHFGLNAFPFTTSPDPRFYFPSVKHKEALACLMFAIQQRKGFALVTGEVGAGKSMLCRAALERLGEGVDAAVVVHSSLSARQFFQAICAEFNLNARNASKIELIHKIKAFLIQRNKENRTVVLMVDEAQDLTSNVLEEVRLLGNLETESVKLLQIILVGQPELRHLIGTPELRQLNQRLTVKFHLGTLSEEEVGQYIGHRLGVAGATNDGIILPEARQAIAQAARGVPRMINVICDQSLLQAFVNEQQTVDVDTVRRVLADMEGYYMDAPAEAGEAAKRVY